MGSPRRHNGPTRRPKDAVADEPAPRGSEPIALGGGGRAPRAFQVERDRVGAASAVASSDVDTWRLTVTPPPQSDGVASMLVALGRAGVVVFQAVSISDSGAYALTLRPGLNAATALTSIGCRIHELIVVDSEHRDRQS